MRDSCSCGTKIYELKNNEVIIHNVEKELTQTHIFDTNAEAEEFYNYLTKALTN